MEAARWVADETREPAMMNYFPISITLKAKIFLGLKPHCAAERNGSMGIVGSDQYYIYYGISTG